MLAQLPVGMAQWRLLFLCSTVFADFPPLGTKAGLLHDPHHAHYGRSHSSSSPPGLDAQSSGFPSNCPEGLRTLP